MKRANGPGIFMWLDHIAGPCGRIKWGQSRSLARSSAPKIETAFPNWVNIR